MPVFYPEHNSSATLPFDTAEYLADKGYTVGALCGYPKEYSTDSDVPISETKSGVKIRRIRYLQLKRKSRIGRIINYLSFTLSVIVHIWSIAAYRTVIVYSNPPVLPLAALIARKLFHTEIIFVSYDVYPEIAFASGSLSKRGIITKFMMKINSNLFKCAKTVVALTDEMKAFLLMNRPELTAGRVATIPNWAHESTTAASAESFTRFGFNDGDFIVSYFGNLGICQDEKALIDAMEILKDHPHIKFLIAGHGSKIPAVQEVAEYLQNVKICGFLTGDEFSSAMEVSSCGIVSLKKGLHGMCAPSKYYSYLQAGLPVLAVVEDQSYIAEELRQTRSGLSSDVGNGDQLVKNILALYDSPALAAQMSDSASSLYCRKYAKEIGLAKYASLLNDAPVD